MVICDYVIVRNVKVKCKNSGTIGFNCTTANYKIQELEEILKNLFIFDGILHCYIDSDGYEIKKVTLKGIGKKVRIFDIKKNSLSSYSNEFVFENIFFICQNNFNVNNLFSLFSNGIKDERINLNCNLLFNKCTFTINGKQRIQYINFKKLSFQNCRFLEDIYFKECSFSDICNLENPFTYSFGLVEQIYFYNCKFYILPIIKGIKNRIRSILFYYSHFHADIDFDNSEILDHKILVNFMGSEFYENVIFNTHPMRSNITHTNQNEKTRLFYSAINFDSVKFHKNINLASVTFFNQIDFSNSEFYGDLDFGSYNFHKNIEKPILFLKCKFHKNVYISSKKNIDVSMYFNHADFFGVVRFDNNNFNKPFLIIGSRFYKEVYFEGSKFKEFVNFSNATFNKNISLIQTNFFKDVIFDKARVYKNIDFYNALFGSNVSFKSTEFKSFINFNSAKFKNIPILGAALIHPNATINIAYLDIEKIDIEEIDNSLDIYNRKSYVISSPLASCFYEDKLLTLTNIRETCRIFKDILLKENNIINATAYKKIELYINELEYFYKDNPKLNSFDDIETDNISSLKLRDKIDWWFLKLNRTTSDHHTDFLKILLFTLSVIGGYFMMNLNLGLSSDIYEIKNFNILFFISAVVVLIVSLFLMYKKIIKFDMWFILTFLFIGAISYFFIGFYYEWLLSLGLPIIFIGVLVILLKVFSEKLKISYMLFAIFGIIGIVYSPSIITPFLGAFSEDARNHYLYKAIDDLDDKKALELARIILPNDKDLKEFEPSKTILSKNAKLEQISIFDKTDLSVNFIYEQSNQDKNEQSVYKAKKTLKDYKDELKSSDLLDKAPELKQAVAIDGGVSRLNIAYYLVLAFCIFALQKTMRKNSIIPS